MVIVMDMSTGRRIDDFGAYEDEVLGASWLPQPEPALQLQSAPPARPRVTPPLDVEAFLRTMYLAQE